MPVNEISPCAKLNQLRAELLLHQSTSCHSRDSTLSRDIPRLEPIQTGKNRCFIRTAYFTICARNYLAYALTLRDSVLEHLPHADFIIFLADEGIVEDDISRYTVSIRELGHPNLEKMAFQYTLMEFATAIKPMCFLYLLEKKEYSSAIYLDPDIQIFAPLHEVEEKLSSGTSCVLTPHIMQPLQDTHRPSEVDILQSGTFNLGFAGFSNSQESYDFLRWWDSKLQNFCYNEPEYGLFVDQKFMDMAPSFLKNLVILRHPGYNVAYWNLKNRRISKNTNGWQVDGQPLVFFHFSGVSPENPTTFSKHQDRFTLENIGPVKGLLLNYIEQLKLHNHSDWTAIPYAFGFFSDGTPIPPIMRSEGVRFGTSISSFDDPKWDEWNRPSEEVDAAQGVVITRFMFAIHRSRTDLRDTFPLSNQRGQKRFMTWFIRNAAREAKAPSIIMDGVRKVEPKPKQLIRKFVDLLRALKR